MFSDLPKYAETTSNSFWSTRTPAHWAVRPGLAVLQENRRKNTGLIETQVLSLSYGQVVVKPIEKQHGLVPDSYEGYQVLEPGDIVVRPTDQCSSWARQGPWHHHFGIHRFARCRRMGERVRLRIPNRDRLDEANLWHGPWVTPTIGVGGSEADGLLGAAG